MFVVLDKHTATQCQLNIGSASLFEAIKMVVQIQLDENCTSSGIVNT